MMVVKVVALTKRVFMVAIMGQVDRFRVMELRPSLVTI